MGVFEPKKILVATDLTPASQSAVALAADLSETLEAEVILFNAISPITYVDYGAFDDDTMSRAVVDQSKRIEARLAEMAKEYFPQHVRVQTRAVSGYPISSICATADGENVDLIIMGTHGRNPVMSFLIGSVVQGVQFRTSRPIITVPPAKNPMEQQEIMTILCPVNFTDIALKALEHAAQLGAKLGADVLALHLVEPEEIADLRDVTRRLDQWIPESIKEVCEVRVLVRRGDAAEEVVRYANQQNVDLIVIGAKHKRFADTTVLGTTTERVTRHAHCAVMTVMTPQDVPGATEKKEIEEPATA